MMNIVESVNINYETGVEINCQDKIFFRGRKRFLY